MNFSPTRLRTAAIFGLLAVALGAMGAHGLKSHWKATLEAAEVASRLEVWKTASIYHLAHSIVLLVIALVFTGPKQARGAWCCLVTGVVLFSGSLYILSLMPSWTLLGPVTPIGGVLLIVGWLLLAFHAESPANIAATPVPRPEPGMEELQK